MSWRTVVVSSRCKLDTKMGYMVIRGEDTRRIFLDEIAILLIENPAVSLTGCLLEELVAEKIAQQAGLLAEQRKQREALLLESYIPQIEFQDATNREGHAAKVYFNALFGMDFSRREDNPVNAALNYGYSLLLSAFNREIAACGYLTQLGLHHDNVFNHFNLSSDLMEPFRVLIDRRVLSLEFSELDKNVRLALVNVLSDEVTIRDSTQTVLNAVRIYVKSVFDALNEGEPERLEFYRP